MTFSSEDKIASDGVSLVRRLPAMPVHATCQNIPFPSAIKE
jgi:hypothetical protein